MVTAGDYKATILPKFIDFLNDDMIIAWFCVHLCDLKHPKYHWMPLGIFQPEELNRKKSDLNKIFALWHQAPKNKLLCSNFGLRPKFKSERKVMFDVFEQVDFCYKAERKPFFRVYQGDVGI